VREPSNSLKSEKTLDLYQYSRVFELNHLLYCAAMFFIFMIFRVFLPDFLSRDLMSFFFDFFHRFGC
jgi:hypothetical protein